MKYLMLTILLLCVSIYLYAQKYPEPEFNNEVVFLKKTVPILCCGWRKKALKWKAKQRSWLWWLRNGLYI
ncbi:MAG: hypothetical protein IPH56_14745 [Chitinophagaceae bacterium]|nr:hypothetical protein [Chitinophagaceae bacterium]